MNKGEIIVPIKRTGQNIIYFFKSTKGEYLKIILRYIYMF